MSKFDKITDAMTNIVGPFAKAVSDNNAISALTQGFMYTMPITLGVAAIAVLVNLPIAPWTAFLQSTGLYTAGTEVVSLTLSLLAIYVVGAIAYAYTHIRKENEMIGLIMAMGSFLILIPIYNAVDPATNSTVATIKTSYLGSDGILQTDEDEPCIETSRIRSTNGFPIHGTYICCHDHLHPHVCHQICLYTDSMG